MGNTLGNVIHGGFHDGDTYEMLPHEQQPHVPITTFNFEAEIPPFSNEGDEFAWTVDGISLNLTVPTDCEPGSMQSFSYSMPDYGQMIFTKCCPPGLKVVRQLPTAWCQVKRLFSSLEGVEEDPSWRQQANGRPAHLSNPADTPTCPYDLGWLHEVATHRPHRTLGGLILMLCARFPSPVRITRLQAIRQSARKAMLDFAVAYGCMSYHPIPPHPPTHTLNPRPFCRRVPTSHNCLQATPFWASRSPWR